MYTDLAFFKVDVDENSVSILYSYLVSCYNVLETHSTQLIIQLL